MAVSRRQIDGLYVLLIGASGFGAVLLLGRLIARLVQIAGNHAVPIDAGFARTVPIPIGDISAPVAVTAGTVSVTGIPAFSLSLVFLGELLVSGTPVALLVLLGVLCLRMSRGRIFDRTNSRLLMWGGFTLSLGIGVGSFIAHMGSNGALAQLSGDTLRRSDNPGSADWFALLGGLVVVVFGYVVDVGIRMRRETEGLV